MGGYLPRLGRKGKVSKKRMVSPGSPKGRDEERYPGQGQAYKSTREHSICKKLKCLREKECWECVCVCWDGDSTGTEWQKIRLGKKGRERKPKVLSALLSVYPLCLNQ